LPWAFLSILGALGDEKAFLCLFWVFVDGKMLIFKHFAGRLCLIVGESMHFAYG
jgi:hypothetical protein